MKRIGVAQTREGSTVAVDTIGMQHAHTNEATPIQVVDSSEHLASGE